MGSSQVKMVLILLLAAVSSVLGHGGMVWPPIWQDGKALGLEEVYLDWISTDPPQVDPKTGRKIDNTKQWSTDQAYTYGHGENETLAKTAPHTNFVDCTEAEGGCCDSWTCARFKHPWAAPGRAPNLGGGCGIHGGNPYGCPAGQDEDRPPGSVCGRTGMDRGTWSFGSSALEIEFPEARTTKWSRGSAWRKEFELEKWTFNGPLIFKDHVVVPEDLEPGQYVLGWRWDAVSGAQVWVSCANIEII